MTGLERFIEAADDTTDALGQARDTIIVLAFSFESLRYAVAVERVVRVISMRPVTRVPGAHPGLAGAIQDHGRVIGLLAHPLARGGGNAPATRTIVCRTARGLLGLPVSAIHDQQAFTVQNKPEHGQVIEHDAHAYTFIDPEALGVVCRAGSSQPT